MIHEKKFSITGGGRLSSSNSNSDLSEFILNKFPNKNKLDDHNRLQDYANENLQKFANIKPTANSRNLNTFTQNLDELSFEPGVGDLKKQNTGQLPNTAVRDSKKTIRTIISHI